MPFKLKGEPTKMPTKVKKNIGDQEDSNGARGSYALKNKLSSQITAINKSMKA